MAQNRRTADVGRPLHPVHTNKSKPRLRLYPIRPVPGGVQHLTNSGRLRSLAAGNVFHTSRGGQGDTGAPRCRSALVEGWTLGTRPEGGVDRTEGEPCPAVTPQPSASPAIAMERSGSTNHYASHPDQNQAQARDLRRSDVVAEHVAPDDNANCREHGPGYSCW